MCVKLLVKLCFYTDPLKFTTVNKNLAGRPKKLGNVLAGELSNCCEYF